jgi:hypothetical protein
VGVDAEAFASALEFLHFLKRQRRGRAGYR